MPNIVVLDGYTLNPGDLSWDGLKAAGDCTVYDRTSREDIIKRSKDADIVITNKVPFDKNTLEKLPLLKYIGVTATGYNIIDTGAAKERNIPVTNVPEYGTNSVAQMVFAFILEYTRHVAYHSETVRNGRWSKNPDFCYWDYPLIELDNLTMGIIGYGRIGKKVAEISQAFGMKVVVFDPHYSGSDNVELIGLDEIFKRSDVISLHCPLTPGNIGMVNAERLSLMKKTAFLINTGRGPLVNDKDLADALNEGKIAGAGLDVLTVEPPESVNPLLTAKNCIITPHISWATFAARKRLMDTVVMNVKAFLDGKPVNVVNM
jgi:glycerate dehydrogenase